LFLNFQDLSQGSFKFKMYRGMFSDKGQSSGTTKNISCTGECNKKK